MAIQWHISSSYPLHNAEGRLKWRQYPPPYNGGYATPWCWVDGKNASYIYYYWEDYVNSALMIPADVQINLTGTYNTETRIGQVQAEFVNSSSSSISANAYFVITEDSLYYVGPNGDPWHNHVCRDYIPDQNGTSVTIPENGQDTLTQSFTLDSGWNVEKCNMVVYLQDPTIQPDSSKITFQGATIKIAQLTGISEEKPKNIISDLRIAPNPCKGILEINLKPSTSNVLQLRDVAGRILKQVSVSASDELVQLDLNKFSNGIYFVSLANNPTARYKIVLNK